MRTLEATSVACRDSRLDPDSRLAAAYPQPLPETLRESHLNLHLLLWLHLSHMIEIFFFLLSLL